MRILYVHPGPEAYLASYRVGARDCLTGLKQKLSLS
jgi:hypothetical protein